MGYKTRQPCPICGLVTRRSGQTCGKPDCKKELCRQRYGEDWPASQLPRATKAASESKRRKRRDMWAARFPGIALEICDQIYRQGCNSGTTAAHKSEQRRLERAKAQGFDQGYRQAELDAMAHRRTA